MDYKIGISSMSLGRAWVHQLPNKLDEAAKHQYQGIEVFHEDLEYLAKSMPGGLTPENCILAARNIKQMCADRHMEIINLQPFMHYEGLTDPKEHAERIEKLKFWFKLAHELGTDLIQLPSNFQAEGTTGDRDIAIRDLIEVAEMGLKETPVIRFAYENLCWGKYIDTWEGAWDLVSAVDRPNFGICLDTFNIAGRAWADPASPDGKIPNADENLRISLEKMKKTIDVRKVFFVQVVDAERLRNPLTKDHIFHVDGQPSRMSWSRNARLFPFEKAGYLPIIDVLRVFTEDLGFKGWVSLELFSRTMADPSPSCPRDHARRGIESWWKLVKVMGWEGKVAERETNTSEATAALKPFVDGASGICIPQVASSLPVAPSVEGIAFQRAVM